MSLFTIDEVTFAAFEAVNLRPQESFDYISKRFLENESEKQKHFNRFDIFLSHANKDKTIVIGLYSLLVAMGFKVYVDWIHDPLLNRSKVSAKTARILKDRMRQCACLMYATTKNHPRSQWMPWEAGYFHGYDGHVGIIPVIRPGSTFKGQEYLDLYPYAEKSLSGSGKKALKITDRSNPTKSKLYPAWVLSTVI